MRRLVLGIVLLIGLAVPVFADGPVDEKPTRREHEILRERPSGFWTSNKPVAAGEEYRWRLLAIGAGVMAITGFFVIRAIRRSRN